jgi:DNA polymerase-3 subunit beta
MKCTVDRLDLLKAVEFTSQFTLVNSAKPVLENVKLVLSDDSITVSAFDGEAQAEYRVECDCDFDSTVLVNANKILKLLKSSDSGDLNLSVEGDDDQPTLLTIANFDDTFELPCCQSDLPALPSVSHYHSTLPSGLMARANAMTVATDDTTNRYALQGIWLNLTPSSVEVASTDGRRLMYYHSSFETQDTGTLIIPAQVIKRIGKLGEAEISFNENLYLISSGNIKVAGRQIEGRYPAVNKVLESVDGHPEASRVIDRALLLGSLRRASLMTTDESRGVNFIGSGRCLTLKAENASVGKASVKIDCEREEGDANFEVTLDVKLLKELAESLNAETVTLNFFGEDKAVSLVGNGIVCVQMPMLGAKPKASASAATA